MRMSRVTRHRPIGRLAVAAVAVLVLAVGCGGGDEGAGGSSSDEQSTLTIAMAADVQTLDPAYANFIEAHWAIQQMYDTPVNLETQEVDGALVARSTKIEPMAFESWERSADGLTYTVKIRQGMRFHDGSPVTAEAVKWTFDRNLATKGGMNWLLTNIGFIKEAKLVDDFTIELRAEKPSVLAMPALYMDGGGIMDPDSIKPHATPDDPWAEKWLAKNAANSSGPYVLESRIPDQELVFRAFDDYWAGPPKIKKIVWKVVPSTAQRLSLLKDGAVDIAYGLPPDQLASLEGTAGVKVARFPSDTQILIGLNNLMPPFDDKSLRQAVAYAVDYDSILEEVYRGHAQRAYGPIVVDSPFAVPESEGYRTDLAQAKQLVEASGYDGEQVTLSIDSSRSVMREVAVRVKSQLAAVGINVEIEQLTPAVFAERQSQKKLQMYVGEMLPWISDPNYVLSLLYQCEVFGNYVGYCSDKVDEVINAGWAETDEEKRKSMFLEAQRQIIDDAPYVWLAQPAYELAVRDDVDGFVYRQNEIPWFYTIDRSP
jgi:peptide/nickel transport system substrate-binding protein